MGLFLRRFRKNNEGRSPVAHSEAHRYMISGDLVVDRVAAIAHRGGEVIPLTQKPFNFLIALMEQPELVVDRDALIEKVWAGRAVSDAVISSTVRALRQALGESARDPEFIQTVHGRGYKFLLPVDNASSAPNTLAGEEATLTLKSVSALFSSTSFRLFVALASVVILGVAGLSISRPGTDADSGPQVQGQLRLQSIAVLPFEDYSADQSQQWIADGLAEEMLNELAQIPELLVTSRRASFQFRDNTVPIAEVADALGVTHVVEGSVRRDGPKVRVTVQLIRANDSFHLWSKNFDAVSGADDLFGLQEAASEALAVFISGQKLQPRPDEPLTAEQIEALFLTRRGAALLKRREPQSLMQGIELLNKAVALDPTSGFILATLGEAKLLSVPYLGADRQAMLLEAEALITQALEISPKQSEVYSTAAFLEFIKRDFKAASQYADVAVALNPNSVAAHHRKAMMHQATSNLVDAEASLQAALARDPISPILNSSFIMVSMRLGKIDEASELARNSLRWNPGNALLEYNLGRIYQLTGDYQQAVEFFDRSLALNANHEETLFQRAHMRWMLGRPDEISPEMLSVHWPLRALVALQDGRESDAAQLADEFRASKFSPVSPLEVAYYAGGAEVAAQFLNDHLALMPLDSGRSAAEWRRVPAVIAYAIMKESNDPRADQLYYGLNGFFEELTPDSAKLVSDFYAGAVWSMANGDRAGAIAWLTESMDRGHIIPELMFDPTFDALRETPEFQKILQQATANQSSLQHLLP